MILIISFVNYLLCEVDVLNFNFDVLNNFNANGVPPHNLKLKVGDVCIVVQNLAKKEGLTNNNKVNITKIHK